MKIGIIIQREYLTRVKKKSFLIITFLTPILFAALMFLPSILMLNSEKLEDKRAIAVCDESGIFKGKFEDTDANSFIYSDQDLDELKALVKEGVYDGVLFIPATQLNVPTSAELYSQEPLPMTLTSHIKSNMKQAIEHQKLLASGIDPDIVKSAMGTTITLQTVRMDEVNGEEVEKKSFGEFEMIFGLFLAMIIYFVVFLFGSQVMRGVIEEKTNRIIEVLVCSVKPFELMMGKIIGIALVGLTQFVLWIVLSLGIYTAVTMATGTPDLLSNGTVMSEQVIDAQQITEGDEMLKEVMDVVHSINFSEILWCFLLYFIGGYFLYAAMFAATGSACDNETDSQQFTLPISIPLILAIVCSTGIANAPNSSLSIWLSMIPFTSPVAMMLRIPYGVPYWQIGVSAAILVLTFVIFTWLAAKIYRTGILMYGKKVSWKELLKWLRY
ncbi:MAG: ABC transporter permease [Bacteroidales bacterium]|nr:ABC transporter permease [Bacteroidales bacterium]